MYQPWKEIVAPSRVRGLKHSHALERANNQSVAPSRVRGLKRVNRGRCNGRICRTLTGAWIETALCAL